MAVHLLLNNFVADCQIAGKHLLMALAHVLGEVRQFSASVVVVKSRVVPLAREA